jgi:hypothetical protein
MKHIDIVVGRIYIFTGFIPYNEDDCPDEENMQEYEKLAGTKVKVVSKMEEGYHWSIAIDPQEQACPILGHRFSIRPEELEPITSAVASVGSTRFTKGLGI